MSHTSRASDVKSASSDIRSAPDRVVGSAQGMYKPDDAELMLRAGVTVTDASASLHVAEEATDAGTRLLNLDFDMELDLDRRWLELKTKKDGGNKGGVSSPFGIFKGKTLARSPAPPFQAKGPAEDADKEVVVLGHLVEVPQQQSGPRSSRRDDYVGSRVSSDAETTFELRRSASATRVEDVPGRCSRDEVFKEPDSSNPWDKKDECRGRTGS